MLWSISVSNKTIYENKFINIDDDDISQVVAVLQERQLAGTARIVGEYEGLLATYFGVKYALAVSSGTAALHLLLYLYEVKVGDEVIVPPTAPIMSALPILAVGARPVFVDTYKNSFGYDINDLEKKITFRTKAIITVPMWGYGINTRDVKEIAGRHGIPVIEDASHCHGAKEGGQFIGTSGDVGFFSTQERKLISTGEGGFILTNNQEIAEKVKEIRDFGKPFRKTPELMEYIGQYGYLFGLNFRLSALSAGLGISQLHKLPEKIKVRTKHAAILNRDLQDIGWIREIKKIEAATPNYYSIVFNMDHPSMDACSIARHMFQNGIISDTYRFGIKPLYELPIFTKYRSSCPNAENLLRQIITLPTHEGLSEEDLQNIVLQLKVLNT
jgi:perosamine synthetase